MVMQWGTTITQWIRLCLPSCHPGFESSQAHHQCFYQFILGLCHVEKTKINRKRPRLAHFLTWTWSQSRLWRWAISRLSITHNNNNNHPCSSTVKLRTGDSVTWFAEIFATVVNFSVFGQFLVWFNYNLANIYSKFSNFYAIGEFFIVVKGQRLKINLAIWSHWREMIKSIMRRMDLSKGHF